MKELDIVELTQPFNELPIGTKGTIVAEYDGKMFEVEFFDDKNETIGVFTTPKDVLKLLHEF
jgi:hypothetical protein